MTLHQDLTRIVTLVREQNEYLLHTIVRLTGTSPDPIESATPVDGSVVGLMAELQYETQRGLQLARAITDYIDGPQAEAVPAGFAAWHGVQQQAESAVDRRYDV